MLVPSLGVGDPEKEEKTDKHADNEEAGNLSKFRDLSLKDKIKSVYKNTTVEPLLGCYIVASVLANLATQNLNLQKACRVKLALGDQVCTALENRQTANYTHEEILVQQTVADMIVWRTFVQSSVPALLIVFFGSWSDRTGRRKPCMLMPLLGEFLTSIGLMFCTYFFYELPMEVAGLTEAIFPAITGGWMTMFMAVFSYVADITPVHTRTMRVGVVNLFVSVGIPIGTALSGILYRELGGYGVYTIASGLYGFAFLYGWFVIQEKPKVVESKGENARFFGDFFDLVHIKEAFKVAFADGTSNRKWMIILLMIVTVLVFGPVHGEMTVMYMFTRVRFNWDEVDFSIFSTYTSVTNLMGTLFSVSVFSYVLKIDDALIGFMSCVSKILAGFVYAFATTEFIFYLAPLVDIVSGASWIAMRSIISKLVAPHELGQINAVFGVWEALVPLVYGPMYSYVYGMTVDTMPGAFLILGGALTSPAVVIFFWMYRVHKKENKNKSKKPKQLENGGVKTIYTIDMEDKKSVPATIQTNGLDNEAFQTDL